MFFELHDILLHRLWIAARDRRAVFIKRFQANPELPMEGYRKYNKAYFFWSKAVRTTRDWYLDHLRRPRNLSFES